MPARPVPLSMTSRESWSASLAVAIGIATAAGILWVALPGSSGPDCSPYSSGSGAPIQVQIAWSNIHENARGEEHWYNSTISWTVGGLTPKNLEFQVQSPGDGAIVMPGPAWEVTVVNQTGTVVGYYSTHPASPGTWTSTDSSQLALGLTFSLLTSPGNISGDWWTILQVGNSSNGCKVGGGMTWTTV
jgi:hypothetical protein